MLTDISVSFLCHALCQRSSLGASATKSTSCGTIKHRQKQRYPRYQRFDNMLRFLGRVWAKQLSNLQAGPVDLFQKS